MFALADTTADHLTVTFDPGLGPASHSRIPSPWHDRKVQAFLPVTLSADFPSYFSAQPLRDLGNPESYDRALTRAS
jgi:hypothetical protein